MGILNVTPDSFYDGGKYNNIDEAVIRCAEMISNGADIVDIGGESTRPGAEAVSEQEEIDRVIPVIEKISKEYNIPISIDTTKSKVAEEAVKAGCEYINDISGLKFDRRIAEIASKTKKKIILMHTSGRPAEMQQKTAYNNLMDDIVNGLQESIKIAAEAGIENKNIIIDPGIGFGKTVEQNYVIINNIKQFKKLGYPVLIGLSQKSLIWKLYENKEIDRLPATVALNMISVYNGADIIRVHNVYEHKLALRTVEFLMEQLINADSME